MSGAKGRGGWRGLKDTVRRRSGRADGPSATGAACRWACEAGRTEVVHLLLGREGRACPLLKDQAHGLTPRGIALKKGHAECAEIMQVRLGDAPPQSSLYRTSFGGGGG